MSRIPARRSPSRRPAAASLAAAVLLLAPAGGEAAGRATQRFFGPSGADCYSRTYDSDHLARHPAQEVASIWLGRASGGEPDPGGRDVDAVLGFGFSLRGESYSGLAYCRGDRCSLEGDSGEFRLSPDGEALRLTVGSRLSLEGTMDFSPDLARSPDDRVFRLLPASSRSCG